MSTGSSRTSGLWFVTIRILAWLQAKKKSPARHCYLRHLKPNPLFPKSVIGLVWILNYLKNIKWAKFLYTCAINPKNYSIWQLMDFLSAITKQHSHPYVFNLSKIHFLELLNVSEKKKKPPVKTPNHLCSFDSEPLKASKEWKCEVHQVENKAALEKTHTVYCTYCCWIVCICITLLATAMTQGAAEITAICQRHRLM